MSCSTASRTPRVRPSDMFRVPSAHDAISASSNGFPSTTRSDVPQPGIRVDSLRGRRVTAVEENAARRPCPVCDNTRVTRLYSPTFVVPSDYLLDATYDVVCCTHCGA